MQVSPLVDSCQRLIHQKAFRTYHRIAPENRRWIDPEDVIQDGIIAAWEAEQRYKKNRGAKFSTYLYNGLDMLFSGKYTVPLRQKKRQASLLELDAPLQLEDGSTALHESISDDEHPSQSPDKMFEAISGVLRVCHSIPPSALSFFLQVITDETGRILRRDIVDKNKQLRRRNVDFIGCIPETCRRYKVTREDLALVMASGYAKGIVVDGVVKSAEHLGEDDAKVLECLECRELFSLNDARAGRYSATSLTCSACLRGLHQIGPDNSCFGRRKVVKNGRTAAEGYSEADVECRLHCRDRAACRKYIEEREKGMAESVDNLELESELEGVDFSDIEEEEEVPEVEPETKKPATSKKAVKPAATKTVKAAKAAPAKAAKPTKTVKAAPAKAVKATKTVKAAKNVKKAAPAKAAKAAPAKRLRAEPGHAKTPRNTPSGKIDPKVALKKGLIKLDAKGRDLPYKDGSVMRYYLEQALQPGGVSEDSLEKWAMKNGYDHRYQRAVLVSGQNGGTAVRPYATTHTWKVEVKNGRIRVYDLKRIAYYKKIGRLFKK
jgi:hypothetical protein